MASLFLDIVSCATYLLILTELVWTMPALVWGDADGSKVVAVDVANGASGGDDFVAQSQC